MSAQRDHLDRIDVLRAAAILLVYLCHGLPCATGLDKYGLLGWTGVALFFVISGFCIHLSYLKQCQKNPAVSLSNFTWSFWWRRFWRIYPPYLAALIVFWFLQERHENLPAWHFWAHLFLVNNFSTDTFYSIAPPFWSLAVEWQFYLLYPLFLWLLRRVGLRTALICVLVIGIFARGEAAMWQGWHEPLNPALWYSPVALFFDWSLGILLAELWTQKKAARALELIALPALLLNMFSELTPYTRALAFTFAALASAGFMSAYLRRERALGFIERLMIPLGVCSYSFYLWHHPLIGRLMYWFHRVGVPDSVFTNTLLVLVIIPLCFIAWSYAAYVCLEKPAIACGQWLWAKWISRNTLKVKLEAS
jgi:peptidoglycan/LPS O-acetylase OafA/YrhL